MTPRRTQPPATLASFTRDPFEACQQVWAHNLLAAACPGHPTPRAVQRFENEAILMLLVRTGAGRARGRKDQAARLTAAEVAAYLRRAGRDVRTPPPPEEPLATGLKVLAALLGLGELELRLLTFALASEHNRPVLELFMALGGGSAPLGTLMAAALNARPEQVLKALHAKGRLVASGLLQVDSDPFCCSPFRAKDGLLQLLLTPGLTREDVLERYLPRAQAPTLDAEAFRPLAAELALAERLLARALETRRAGVNLLFYGSTGVGKTELARLLAQRLGQPLYAVGMADDEGMSALPHERLSSLMLGHRLLNGAGGLLLFDELEDLLSGLDRSAGGLLKLSKQWFNALLETSPVPTVWISNQVDTLDPAFLRRFTYVIRLPDLGAGERARVLERHLGDGAGLAAADIQAIAERFEASPGQLAAAVASARLLASGEARVERRELERLLAPSVTLLTGRDPLRAPPTFDPAAYRLDAVNASEDLGRLAERLTTWTPRQGKGVSIVLYGPPGTGKSAYVRYLAWRLGRRVVLKRGSEILGPYVGQTEHNIAEAFREAERDGAVLLFDEVDSFLRDRTQARQSWEVSEVNEFLQQLEAFQGLVACTTNLWHDLDAAALRRFVFKIELRPLRLEQALVLFQELLGRRLRARELARVRQGLSALTALTPGDYAAVARNLEALGETPTPSTLLSRLSAEVSVKRGAARAIGFAP